MATERTPIVNINNTPELNDGVLSGTVTMRNADMKMCDALAERNMGLFFQQYDALSILTKKREAFMATQERKVFSQNAGLIALYHLYCNEEKPNIKDSILERAIKIELNELKSIDRQSDNTRNIINVLEKILLKGGIV